MNLQNKNKFLHKSPFSINIILKNKKCKIPKDKYIELRTTDSHFENAFKIYSILSYSASICSSQDLVECHR